MLYVIVALANIFVGGMIGIAGVAGFLLPILYNGFLGLPLSDSLALSFLAFLASGSLGAWRYHRSGRLNIALAQPLCLGSLAGALAGVALSQLIPKNGARLLLYGVVLVSGLSVLLKKESAAGVRERPEAAYTRKSLMLLVGLTTAAVCSLTGAGGPILVVPILTLLGMSASQAVAVALMDSLAIALPATIGYLPAVTRPDFVLLAAVTVVFHGAGTLVGAKLSETVDAKFLRFFVGVLAVGAACYLLVRLAAGF